VIEPVAPAHPIIGGIAPTTAPTTVFMVVRTFNGVYTPTYSAMFNAASPAASPLTNNASTATPTIPLTAANSTACGMEIRPEGSGRLCVRFIRASRGTSRTWLNALADPAANATPIAVTISPIQSIEPTSAMTKPTIPVSTTNALSRLLASSM
jgi:hypothetical protein